MIELVLDILFLTILGLIFTSWTRQISSQRIVNIKLVADEDFRGYSQWKKVINTAINTSSQEFERQLGIKFKIRAIQEVKTGYLFTAVDQFQNQEIKRTNRLGEFKKNILTIPSYLNKVRDLKLESGLTWVYRHINFDDNDLVVFFSGKYYGQARGCVEKVLGRMVLISRRPEHSIEETVQTCIHEFGHIFGAVHTKDVNSIMYAEIGRRTRQFDDINKVLISSHKWKKFKNQKVRAGY